MKCVGGHFSHESGGKGKTIGDDNDRGSRRGERGACFVFENFFPII